MNCSDCVELLQQRLDEGAVALTEAQAGAHLETCVECRALYAAAFKMEKALKQSPAIRPPPDFATRMTSCLLAERRQQQRRRWLTYAASAVAAGLLISLGMKFYFVDQNNPNKVPSLAVDTSHNSTRLQDSVAQAGSAMANMTSRAADETVGPTRHLFASIPKPEWRELPPMDQAGRSLQEVGQGVSSGFEPMATSAHRAFDMLVHNLTPGDSNAR